MLGGKVLRLYLPLACASVLGSLDVGSLLTAALFFYWLSVPAYLLPGNKKPAVTRVRGAAGGRWDIQYMDARVADIRAISSYPWRPGRVFAVTEVVIPAAISGHYGPLQIRFREVPGKGEQSEWRCVVNLPTDRQAKQSNRPSGRRRCHWISWHWQHQTWTKRRSSNMASDYLLS